MLPLEVTILIALSTAVVAVVVVLVVIKSRYKNLLTTKQEITNAANKEAEELKRKAEEKYREKTAQADNYARSQEQKVHQRQQELSNKQNEIARFEGQLKQKELSLTAARAEIDSTNIKLKSKELELAGIIEKEKQELQRISELSKEQASKIILEKLDSELDKEKAQLIRKRLEESRDISEKEARKVIIAAIHRFAASHTAENVTTVIDLPNEEMKGRIIGREGRNIRAFESLTGVDVLIDEAPGSIGLSSFDGVRREISKRAMERLITDGRIHPTRIEEIVEQVKREMEQEIIQVGKQFLFDNEINNVHPKLQTLIGRLKFRTSYGQNVLQHVKEVAHSCAVMAAEIGLDSKLAKRCGVFHDIGKAVDHTFEGSHPVIGGELLRRFGESKEVIESAEHHHSDPNIVQYSYTVITAAADAISASRPGARDESPENYIKKIEKLETLAKSFQGVNTAYAVQAGREIRVIVDSDNIGDDKALLLARDIAKAIEDQLTYPGEIKVTVIREKRVVEYAR